MSPDGAINRGDLWNGLLASTWSPASELEKEQTEKVPRYRAKVWAKDLECTNFLRAMEASNQDQPWDAHQAHLARLTKSILELERNGAVSDGKTMILHLDVARGAVGVIGGLLWVELDGRIVAHYGIRPSLNLEMLVALVLFQFRLGVGTRRVR
jgi:hypothetical protein